MYLIDELKFITTNNSKILMVNLINGAIDIITSEVYEKIKNKKFDLLSDEIIESLINRRYLFSSIKEKTNFLSALDKRINKLERETVPNYLIIPTFACNLNCIYCYEKTYQINHTNYENEKLIVNKQFEFISNHLKKFKNQTTKEFSAKDISITLMGGEPLLASKKPIIEYIIEKINENNYSYNIITNGVELDYYIDYLKKYTVDYIQITLDGPPEIHDKRRYDYNGNGSFDKILLNIKKALDSNINVVIRCNVDKENVELLPELAKLLINKFGSHEFLHSYIFLMKDGGCAGESNVINEGVGIDKIFNLEKKHPEMKIFKKKFHGAQFVNKIFNNEPYFPSLRHCAAATNQYILDYKGYVYKCWHGIGNENYSVGRYIPEVKLNQKIIKLWENREARQIPKCKICKYRYICGTGCPSSGHKDNSSATNILIPYCDDYEKVLDKIISQKYENIL